MKFSQAITIVLAAAMLALLPAFAGCASGGADVYLQNISIGSLTAEGKPITGLPTQKVNIVLKTGATKILVSRSDNKTIITLEPSGAVVISSNEGLSFTGLEPDQVEIKWTTDNTTK